MCLLLGLEATGLPTKRLLSFSVNALTFIKERQSWRPYKEEVLAAFSKAFIYTATKGCLIMIHIMPQWVSDLQEG